MCIIIMHCKKWIQLLILFLRSNFYIIIIAKVAKLLYLQVYAKNNLPFTIDKSHVTSSTAFVG